VVSLLTDYGWADGFVGALHSVLRRQLPDLPIVDLTHAVPAQDVRAGSFALERAAPYLAPGVVVAVVDPGVGTARRGVALRVRDSDADAPDLVLVGPDNGLLLRAADALGGISLAVELEQRDYWLSARGPTFAGRDIFAPVAAHLAAGGDILALGPPIGPETLARLPAPAHRRHLDGSLEAEVTWVDHYGNIQLAAGPDDLVLSGEIDIAMAPLGGAGTHPSHPGPHQPGPGPAGTSVVPPAASPADLVARPWTCAVRARTVRAFGDLAPGELGLFVDSYGRLALCLYSASAAGQLGVDERNVLLLRPAGPPSTY
jgi:hypothetical protein